MRYGIEIVNRNNCKEFFGYKEDLDTGRRVYVCHAYTEEICNQMLDKIINSK